MNLASAIFFCAWLFLSVTDVLLKVFRLPLLAAFPVALALIVSFESLVLNILSRFSLVTAPAVVLLHLPLIFFWIHRVSPLSQWRLRYTEYWRSLRYLFRPGYLKMLLPLLFLLFMGAALYPPNTYDSMSYHMSRVAHWIGNQSIDYYATSVERQNVMGPGAEYLILIPQLLAKSDLLAYFVQYMAYLTIIGGIAFLTRLFFVPGHLRGPIVLLSVAAPMAIMQATSTQNDLVAASMSLAILVSARRLIFGSCSRMRIRDFGLIGACIASGYLVKPTSLLAVAPFLGIGLVRQGLRGEMLRAIKACIPGICIAATVCVFVAGPDLYRKYSHQVSRYEVYPLFAKWDGVRLKNIVAGIGHNVPQFQGSNKTLLGIIGYEGPFDNKEVLTVHEDLVGNPFQVLTMIVLTVVTVVLAPLLVKFPKYSSAFWFSLAPFLAWGVFGLIVKDQLWIPRLQLPLFSILPFSFVYPLVLAGRATPIFTPVKVLLRFLALIALSYAVVVACNNPHRPLSLAQFWGQWPDRGKAYYNNALDEDRHSHQYLLNTARAKGCRQIGLLLGSNSNEYPLTWRLMSEGRDVRHQFVAKENTDAEWPCLYYMEFGQESRLPGRGVRWRTADGHTYSIDLEREFSKASNAHFPSQLPPKVDASGIVAVNAQVTGAGGSLIVRAENEDPQVYFSEKIKGDNFTWLILEMKLTASVDTVTQVFFRSRAEEGFNELRSAREATRSGENTLYFLLPADEAEGGIRIDPGMVAGDYIIHSLEIRPII